MCSGTKVVTGFFAGFFAGLSRGSVLEAVLSPVLALLVVPSSAGHLPPPAFNEPHVDEKESCFRVCQALAELHDNVLSGMISPGGSPLRKVRVRVAVGAEDAQVTEGVGAGVGAGSGEVSDIMP